MATGSTATDVVALAASCVSRLDCAPGIRPQQKGSSKILKEVEIQFPYA